MYAVSLSSFTAIFSVPLIIDFARYILSPNNQHIYIAIYGYSNNTIQTHRHTINLCQNAKSSTTKIALLIDFPSSFYLERGTNVKHLAHVIRTPKCKVGIFCLRPFRWTKFMLFGQVKLLFCDAFRLIRIKFVFFVCGFNWQIINKSVCTVFFVCIGQLHRIYLLTPFDSHVQSKLYANWRRTNCGFRWNKYWIGLCWGEHIPIAIDTRK